MDPSHWQIKLMEVRIELNHHETALRLRDWRRGRVS